MREPNYLRMKLPCDNSMNVLCDNQALISIARNPVIMIALNISRLIITSLKEDWIKSDQLILDSCTHQLADIWTRLLSMFLIDWSGGWRSFCHFPPCCIKSNISICLTCIMALWIFNALLSFTPPVLSCLVNKLI